MCVCVQISFFPWITWNKIYVPDTTLEHNVELYNFTWDKV